MKYTAALAALVTLAAAAPTDGIIDIGDGVKLVPREPRAHTRLERLRTFRRGLMEGLESGERNSSDVSYDSNWAGAVKIGTGLNDVTGTIVVPTPSVPSGGSSTAKYAASAWVGIDGDTCTSAILQTGVDFYAGRGGVSFDAWYEWYPNYAYDFSGFSVSAGDTIVMTASASSLKAGTVTLENSTTGKKVTQSFSAESSELCEYNAEWIVEDFESGSSLVNFADFDTVTFKDCSPSVSGSTIVDIRQSLEVLTECSTTGTTTVTCEYVG
ncbi:acid proteinase [Cryphonectria parasitica EP155]|uniref:Acid proteinase n=2 Tax=Cryphonectria parasitica TaxID=5116 RepID=A0A9P4XW26_CRYP1|nr:acid proteinase [Cryphonectria parasitica EP155]KAF3761891.1 acid proteinase [Cryphonectria parasitica EP155]CAA58822.1 acid proteinase [Cryphonectria parasitica]